VPARGEKNLFREDMEGVPLFGSGSGAVVDVERGRGGKGDFV